MHQHTADPGVGQFSGFEQMAKGAKAFKQRKVFADFVGQGWSAVQVFAIALFLLAKELIVKHFGEGLLTDKGIKSQFAA